jgi:hypothetical protein
VPVKNIEISPPIDCSLARTGIRETASVIFTNFVRFRGSVFVFVDCFPGHDTRLDSSPRRSLEDVFEELESAFQLLQANI